MSEDFIITPCVLHNDSGLTFNRVDEFYKRIDATGCVFNFEGVETISPKGRMIATILLPFETSIPTAFINLSLLKIVTMDKYQFLLIAYSIYCGVTRMHLR